MGEPAYKPPEEGSSNRIVDLDGQLTRSNPEGDDSDKRVRFQVTKGGGEPSGPARGNLRSVRSRPGLPKEDQPDIAPDIRPELGVIPGGGESSGPARGNLGAVRGQEHHPTDADGGTPGATGGADSPEQTRQQEEEARGLGDDSEDDDEEDGLFDPDGDRPTGPLAKSRQRIMDMRGRVQGAAGNKWLWALVGGLAGTMAIILVFFMLIGSLGVPNLAEHVLEHQFARLARNNAEHTAAITAEDTAFSTAKKALLEKMAKKFAPVSTRWGSMVDRINNYRPDKILGKLKTDGKLTYKYERGPAYTLWKKKLTAIVVNGEEIPVSNASAWRKLVHPLNSRSERLAMSDSLNQGLADAMEGRSALMRGRVAKALRAETDVQLKWWRQLDKYNGVTEEQAKLIAEAEAIEQISDDKVTPSKVSQLQDAEEEAKKELQECGRNKGCLQEMVNSGGKMPGTVLKALDKVVNANAFQRAVGATSTLYTVGLPLCLIYEGSIDNPDSGKDMVDNTSNQDVKTFYALETGADQQKYGHTNAQAVGGLNWKVGDTTQSIPYQRASGQPVYTLNEGLPQGSADGKLQNQTSIFAYLGSTFGGLADKLVGPSCGVISNVWVGAGTAFAGIVAGFFSGGATAIAQQGLAKALAIYIRDDVIGRVFAKKELAKLGIIGGGTVGLTLYAKTLTAKKAGLTESGAAVGTDFANAADKGGNLHANELCRNFYGRPLTNIEVEAAATIDHVYTVSQNSRKSTFERYFATSNANSLVMKTGMAVNAHVNTSIFADFFTKLGAILSPLTSLLHVAGSFSHSVAFAASSDGSDTQNYGVVQCGWSNAEEELIRTTESYLPVENQAIIAGATYEGKPAMDAIAAKYNKCFGYDADGNLDEDATMGALLANKDIVRTNKDIVPNEGLCAPAILSFNSPDPAAFDPQTGKNDLIFRYRLEKNYELTLDQLQSIQDAK